MKILFLMNHIIMGGLEKVLLEYLCQLDSSGYDVVVLSKEKVTDDYFLGFFNQHNIKLIDDIFSEKKAHFFVKKRINKFLQKKKLNNLFKSSDCIIDFANFSFHNELKNVSKQKIGYCHGSILFFNSLIDKSVLDIYDDIVCLSDSFKNEFVKMYPDYKNKIRRIYNPINKDNVINLSKKDIDVKSPYFVAVQRLDSVDKDIPTIIKSFNMFCKNNKQYFLYIIGDGPQREELEVLAGKNKRIVFMGKIDNPYPYIKNATALILSSTKNIGEGLPNTLLEAQTLETLAISSDVPSGPHEILIDGKAGLLFKPGDSDDLLKILFGVTEGKYDIEKITNNATKHLTRFSAENNVNDLLTLMKTTGV